jgi:hypothetical protein
MNKVQVQNEDAQARMRTAIYVACATTFVLLLSGIAALIGVYPDFVADRVACARRAS